MPKKRLQTNDAFPVFFNLGPFLYRVFHEMPSRSRVKAKHSFWTPKFCFADESNSFLSDVLIKELPYGDEEEEKEEEEISGMRTYE